MRTRDGLRLELPCLSGSIAVRCVAWALTALVAWGLLFVGMVTVLRWGDFGEAPVSLAAGENVRSAPPLRAADYDWDNGCAMRDKRAPPSLRGLGFDMAAALARNESLYGPPPLGCVRYLVDKLPDARHPVLDGPRVCVIVRTYHKAVGATFALLHSLFATRYANLHITLVDSFPGESEPGLLERLVHEVNDCRVRVAPVNTAVDWYLSEFGCLSQHPTRKYASIFGYDRTEAELQRLLFRNAALAHESPERCAYFLITNNDNMYSSHLFDAVVAQLERRVPLVTFRYTTHHQGWRVREDDAVDLGAALIHESVFKAGTPAFLTHDMLFEERGVHDADSIFYRKLKARSMLWEPVPKVLFFHQ